MVFFAQSLFVFLMCVLTMAVGECVVRGITLLAEVFDEPRVPRTDSIGDYE